MTVPALIVIGPVVLMDAAVSPPPQLIVLMVSCDPDKNPERASEAAVMLDAVTSPVLNVCDDSAP